MRSIALRGVVAFALLACLVALAHAQEPITDLRISQSPDGTKVSRSYPVGTEVLYAVFRYDSLSDTRVGIGVEGRGITDLYASSARYNGSGQATVELSGALFYKSVTNRLLREAQESQTTVTRATTSSFGLQEYFQQVLASCYTMKALLDYSMHVSLGRTQVDSVLRAQEAVAELEQLLNEALRLPDSDVAGRQAKAELMKRPASSAVVNARQLDQGSASLTRAPFAESLPGDEYTVMATINGSPSATTEFTIDPGTRIFLAKVVRNRR
jgi:hypothetical protein